MRGGNPLPRPIKRLGQHFLRSREILERLMVVAEISQKDSVLEVGAGLGDMTAFLALRAKEVLALELDKRLLEILVSRFREMPNVKVVHGDALRLPIERVLMDLQRPRKVVANLPYNVGTKILLRLAEFPGEIDRMVLMFQKEVAERITAIPGSRSYGSLTVLLALHWKAQLAFVVPPWAFSPRPKVDSAVVVLEPLNEPRAPVGDELLFRKLVKAAFGHRRKTLLNSLKSMPCASTEWVEELLLRVGVDKNSRAETLSVEQFAALSNQALELGLPCHRG